MEGLRIGVFMPTTTNDKKAISQQAETIAQHPSFPIPVLDEQNPCFEPKMAVSSKQLWCRYRRSRMRQFARFQ
jgi:hypothetical protein